MPERRWIEERRWEVDGIWRVAADGRTDAEVLKELGGMEAAICSGCGSVVGRGWAEQPCVLCDGEQHRPAFVVVVKEAADG